MQDELQQIEDWIPEQMEPGTLYMLENPGTMGDVHNPYVAVLACPRCGSLGLITRGQYAGIEPMICGTDHCSADFKLHEHEIEFRKPN